MDGKRTLLLSLGIVAFVSINYVYSIQCYQCNSFDDSGCADFFNNQTYSVHACPEDAKYCRKVVQQAYYEGAWHMRYIRQCATEGELDGAHPNQDWYCYDRIGTYRVKMKYCHCKVDGCNTASGSQISTIVTVLPAIVTLLIYASA